MWYKVSKFILRNRLPLFIVICLVTVYMGYHAKNVEIDYSFSKVIPEAHPSYVEYINFKKQFGEDGDLLIAAVERKNLFELDFYNQWAGLGERIKSIDGIEDVIGITNAYNLVKNKEERRFELVKIPEKMPDTQQEIDAIDSLWRSLPFYHGVLLDYDKNITILVARFNTKKLDAQVRNAMVVEIQELVKEFEFDTQMNVHLSGLPLIRSHKALTTLRELKTVLLYAIVILVVILIFLFRSVMAVLFPMILVGIGIIWGLGLIDLLGYKITILTSLVPNLIVIISIPNCVYLLNKYHTEFRKHGNKIKALSRIIEKIGYVTFFANLTTAIGFGVFYFTRSSILMEFGIVAGIMIFSIFIISIILLPVTYSYLPAPDTRHVHYLDNSFLLGFLELIDGFTSRYRRFIYAFGLLLVGVSAVGIMSLQSRGFILDDVPKDSQIYRDLHYIENKMRGVMPVEILVDTKEKGGVMQIKNLKKIAAIQDSLYADTLFSKPASIVDGLKYATQAYLGGNPRYYRLPRDNPLMNELSGVMSYMGKMEGEETQLATSFMDSSRQVARISVQVPDIGSHRLDELKANLRGKFEAVFDTAQYDITYTGTSIIALEGYRYLTRGLLNSVGIAFVLIAFIMAYLFRSFKMLIISLVPNLIPLFLTAAIMGYWDIPLKPSTVLVFSVAFGISVDFTIHFLAKYKQELRRHAWDIPKTVSITIKETGMSMVFTSMILFFGFITFTASSFDGTKYLGLLVSITLVASLFSNLLLLPSLLLTFDRRQKKN